MRTSWISRTALIAAAITALTLARAGAQSPGQGGTPPAPPAPKPGEGPAAGAKTEGGDASKPDASKPAETAPSAGTASPATPPDGEGQSTFAALLQEGFEVRATTFVPADAVNRQSGNVSSDAVLVTLQKGASSAVCFYTLKAYVSQKLGTIPACTVHR
ncbi:MAG: hypothetical protein AB7V40_03150 [Methyloceanibacter sp.]